MPAKFHLFTILALGAGAAALGATEGRHILGQPGMLTGAVIKNTEGRTVGAVRIDDEGDHKVKIAVTVKGLAPGYHGFHLHAKGVCDPKSIDPATGSPFFSAGPHFDLDKHSHPAHSGDLPNLLIGADGAGRATVWTDRFQIRQLLDKDGSAVVIHSLPDNQANIPNRYSAGGKPGPDAETRKAGDSGVRVACGVIARR